MASPVTRLLGDASLVAVDVGAARGLPANWRPLETAASLLLFEPGDDARRALEETYRNNSRVKVLPWALAGTSGRRSLHVTNTPTGSSLLEPKQDATRYVRSDYLFPIRKGELAVKSLADVLDAERLASCEIVKLDTQGTELEILRGLGERAHKLLCVELEIGVPGAYVGQASLSDVEEQMSAWGLEVFDLVVKRGWLLRNGNSAFAKDIFGVSQKFSTIAPRIGEVDAFYFRKSDAVLNSSDSNDVRRLAVAYCLYGYFDHAYDLIERASMARPDATECFDAIKAWHREQMLQRASVRVAARLTEWVKDHVSRSQRS